MIVDNDLIAAGFCNNSNSGFDDLDFKQNKVFKKKIDVITVMDGTNYCNNL